MRLSLKKNPSSLNLPHVFLTVLIVFTFTFTLSEGKSVVTSSKINKIHKVKVNKDEFSKSPEGLKEPSEGEGNVFLRFAKSVAIEAIQDLKEEARRNPRFGMTINLGNLTALITNGTQGIGSKNLTSLAGLGSLGGLGGLGAVAGIPVTLTFGGLSIKSALIAGLLGLKGVIVQLIISLLWIAFLLSGTAYFVCNIGIISCGGGGGGLLSGLGGDGGGFGGSASSPQSSSSSIFRGPFGGSQSSSGPGGLGNPLNFFNSRVGLSPDQAQPIYKAIDEGYKKYH